MTESQEPAALKKQPNSNHCFACGLKNATGLQLTFYDNGVDEVSCTTTIPDQFNGYPGLAHGGVVAAMMDEVTIRTAMIADPNRMMMTARLDLKYRRPVPTGTELKLIGKLLRDRGRILQASGTLFLPDGSVAVEAQVTAVDLPDNFAMDNETMSQLGWRVYE